MGLEIPSLQNSTKCCIYSDESSDGVENGDTNNAESFAVAHEQIN